MAEEGPASGENWPKDLLLFRATVWKVFQDISESVSLDEFSNNWTILKQKRSVAKHLYNRMIATMYSNMVSSMDELILHFKLTDKFNTLRKIADESENPEDHIAWRPPGDVMEHMRSLDGGKFREYSDKIEEYVTRMEEENRELVQQVSNGRAVAKQADQKADRLFSQERRIRSDFEKISNQLESDIRKMHG